MFVKNLHFLEMLRIQILHQNVFLSISARKSNKTFFPLNIYHFWVYSVGWFSVSRKGLLYSLPYFLENSRARDFVHHIRHYRNPTFSMHMCLAQIHSYRFQKHIVENEYSLENDVVLKAFLMRRLMFFMFRIWIMECNVRGFVVY